MRILFVTSKPFLPEHLSGPNRTLQELALRLAELGHEPVVLAGRGASHDPSPIVCDRSGGFRLFRALDPVASLPALCLTLRPEIAVITDGDYEALAAPCNELDIPLAIWFFEVAPHAFQRAVMEREWLYLASSRFLAARVTALFGVPVEVVPPYVERGNYQRCSSGNRVLFVNPVREKGVELAFALAERRPQVPFTFVESWGLSERWRGSCFERALQSGNIEWLPRGGDMQGIFARTRLLLLPRFSEEGFCRLVTEAQLGGIPVLGSNRGHLAANIGDGGCVLDIDSALDPWLERLDRYVQDDAYREQAGERALAHAARTELQGQTVVERLLGLLAAHSARPRKRWFGGG